MSPGHFFVNFLAKNIIILLKPLSFVAEKLMKIMRKLNNELRISKIKYPNLLKSFFNCLTIYKHFEIISK